LPNAHVCWHLVLRLALDYPIERDLLATPFPVWTTAHF